MLNPGWILVKFWIRKGEVFACFGQNQSLNDLTDQDNCLFFLFALLKAELRIVFTSGWAFVRPWRSPFLDPARPRCGLHPSHESSLPAF